MTRRDGDPTCSGCQACGRGFAPLRVEHGEAVEGLAVCCHAADAACREQASRLRNRDRNAARNIWEVLDASVKGLPRPAYLRRAARRPR